MSDHNITYELLPAIGLQLVQQLIADLTSLLGHQVHVDGMAVVESALYAICPISQRHARQVIR